MMITRNLERLRRLDARVIDGLLALSLVAATELELGFRGGIGGSALVNVAGALLLTLPLAWRRRAPLAVALVYAGTTAAQAVLGGHLFEDGPLFFAVVAGIVAFYSLGEYAQGRAGLAGAVGGVMVMWAGVILSGQIDGQSFGFSAGLVVAAPFLAGRVTRARTLRTAALERERDQRARLAVSDERQRIARELHDVIAHSVGVMVVQADGAGRVLERDPERAREALRSIADTGRTALSEMQRALGVLRAVDTQAALAPQPGIDNLPTLVEQAREAGLGVELAVEGERRPLPHGIDLAGYRIVQEALTNVIKHARGADALVTIRYGARDLQLEVSDRGPGGSPDGAGHGGGHGLVGMQERVALYGGALDAGPGPAGGFVVRASIPLEQ